eukprot:3824532-Pyramimonas_sp.AAC.1
MPRPISEKWDWMPRLEESAMSSKRPRTQPMSSAQALAMPRPISEKWDWMPCKMGSKTKARIEPLSGHP